MSMLKNTGKAAFISQVELTYEFISETASPKEREGSREYKSLYNR